MQSVEHVKFVIRKYTNKSELALHVWRAPGSKTINARIAWGDGTFGSVITDRTQDYGTSLFFWARARFGSNYNGSNGDLRYQSYVQVA